MIKIALIGSTGKLGRRIQEVISKFPNLLISQLISSNKYFDPNIETHILLDVAISEAYKSYLSEALKLKLPLIIGCTGHAKEDLEVLHKAAKQIPILITPNFSTGITTVLNLLKHLPDGKMHIHEVHHTEKRDTPSGTAKRLLEAFPDATVTSERKEGVIGTHTITLEMPHERIKIEHEALSRDLFAYGALQAVSFLYHKPPGLYTCFHDKHR